VATAEAELQSCMVLATVTGQTLAAAEVSFFKLDRNTPAQGCLTTSFSAAPSNFVLHASCSLWLLLLLLLHVPVSSIFASRPLQPRLLPAC